MTHEVIRHLLDDYVTGELTEEARAPVADHIAVCETCSAEVESLKGILARAAELPKSIDPPAEAWSNIRTAILREENAGRSPTALASARWWRRPLVIAATAAAVVVAVLSSTITAAYLNSRSASRPPSALSGRPLDATASASLAAFTIEENNYLRTAATLQDLLDQQETALAPETIAQLKASLRTIDEAILEARSALVRDPNNKVLIEMLSANYQQKVDLLRRSTEMTRGS
jgi:anti-sigma-K factor RskA